MGVVYEGHDDQLDRPVAIKMVRGSDDPRSAERFRREARAAAAVTHPGICQVHAIGEHGGQLFIAMERLEGESLASRVGRGSLPVPEAVQTMLGVLGALRALHERGLVHRDLKPSNVFLTPHGVKLLDFGLVGVGEPDGETRARLTADGVIMGTPPYMSPEQMTNVPVDARIRPVRGRRRPVRGADGDASVLRWLLPRHRAGNHRAAPAGALRVACHHGRGPRDSSCARQAARRSLPVGRGHGGGPPCRDGARRFERGRRGASARSADRAAFPAAASRRRDRLPVVQPRRRDRRVTHGPAGPRGEVSATAMRYAEAAPDLAALAREADVDHVLMGTILRVGSQLRVSTQLVEAPVGTLGWSHTAQIAVGDLFQIQDDLTTRIVRSLVEPLASKGSSAPRRDVPATAAAYEHYLRANQLSLNRNDWPLARELYRRCIDEDPRFAPAWARFGQMVRLSAKYSSGDPRPAYAEAARAVEQALILNPDLSMAHTLYAALEGETGRAIDALGRLIERAKAHPPDPVGSPASSTPAATAACSRPRSPRTSTRSVSIRPSARASPSRIWPRASG